MLHRSFQAGIVASVLLVAPAAQAAAPALSPEDKASVAEATAYLQSLKTVSGRFTQFSPNGTTSTGLLYLQRPGRARFQYDPPAQMLVVSDGSKVSIVDYRLKSFDQYPLSQTPLVLLLARNIRLDRGVVVTNVDHTPDGFTINARDARKQADGRISMRFTNEPIMLRGWTIVDGQGQETRVTLGALSPADHLDPNLFVLEDGRNPPNRP